jgi:hypothetical protein
MLLLEEMQHILIGQTGFAARQDIFVEDSMVSVLIFLVRDVTRMDNIGPHKLQFVVVI